MAYTWSNSKNVTPEQVQKITDTLEAMEVTARRSFFCERIKQLNQEIAEWEQEGKEKCYIDYALSTFSVNDNGLSVTYGSTSLSTNTTVEMAQVLAYAENRVEYVGRQHRREVFLYQSYDKNLEEFLSFEERILRLGGQICTERPYLRITLPVANSSLELATYRICGAAHCFYALKSVLGELDHAYSNSEVHHLWEDE